MKQPSNHFERNERGSCVGDLARIGANNDVVVISVEFLTTSDAEIARLDTVGAVVLDVLGVASKVPGGNGDVDL